MKARASSGSLVLWVSIAYELDDLGMRLAAASGDAQKELAGYARNIIRDFEAELKETVSAVRKAKDRIVR
jgi:hypothetical protein